MNAAHCKKHPFLISIRVIFLKSKVYGKKQLKERTPSIKSDKEITIILKKLLKRS
jgi:hypothetical protein